MKTNPENNETFLSDWMAGRLSDDELRKITSDEDFTAYKKLKDSLEKLEISSPDPDLERNFSAVKEKLAHKHDQKEKRVIPLYRYVAVAVAVVLLVGLYQLFVFSNNIETGFGQTQNVILSDNSHITLNSKSTVSYANLFRYNRTLKLEGQGFFEVEKGSTFTVKTPQGEVKVLGTKFNVISSTDFFEVFCLEGKVSVCSKDKSVILTHGQAVRFYNGREENWTENDERKPLWMSGESGFRNAPLQIVISQLENHYNFQIEYPERLKNVRFTGSFTHKDLETALQSVCLPMNLKYSKTADGKIIISE